MNRAENKFELKSPFALGIIASNKCNLKCQHCINSASIQNSYGLPLGHIFDLIDQCVEYNIPYIDFNGGEIFLRDDFEQMLDYALIRDRIIGITTNGTLITEKWLKKYKGKIYLIRTSLDSIDPSKHDAFRGVKGAFKKTVENMKLAKDMGYNITILTTITKANYKEIANMVSFFQNIATAMNPVPLFPSGRAEEISDLALDKSTLKDFMIQYLKLKEQIKKKGIKFSMLNECPYTITFVSKESLKGHYKCGAGFVEMAVLDDGYALPCASFISVRKHFRIKELNTFQNSLIEIYKNSEIFKKVRDITKIKGKCSKCDYLQFCGGGCRFIAYILSGGDIFAEDPMCWYNPLNIEKG